MTRISTTAVVLLTAAVATAGMGAAMVAGRGADTTRAQRPLPTERIALDTRSGRHVFDVEVARSHDEQEVGLMHRRAVPDDGGMLFPYPGAAPRAFWMRNTFVPLDIVFIGADGRVTGVHPMATPLSDDPIESPGPATAVLELRGGEADEVGLSTGDHVSRIPDGAVPVRAR